MRKGIGVACILLGVLCLLGAVGIVVYNRWEAENAAQVTQTLLQELQVLQPSQPAVEGNGVGSTAQEEQFSATEELPVPGEMATVRLGDYDCIGILSIPVLELELPVLTDWSYEKLKKAPCLYYGSYYEPDFVIAAHNYDSHFGRLPRLQAGDLVVFTDVQGTAHCYEVVLLETLPKEATGEMIASGFDLSLYTCTPGGGSRVTVRCKVVAAK